MQYDTDAALLSYVAQCTKYTPPCCRARYVWWVKQDVPSAAVSRRSNRLVLWDSEHRLQIIGQLRATRFKFLRISLRALFNKLPESKSRKNRTLRGVPGCESLACMSQWVPSHDAAALGATYWKQTLINEHEKPTKCPKSPRRQSDDGYHLL